MFFYDRDFKYGRLASSIWSVIAIGIGLVSHFASAQTASAVYGKWSESSDKKTCEIPVGSSPDEAMVYLISPRGIAFYEFDCAARDIGFRDGGVVFNLDCFKGAAARWFEDALAKPRGSDQLTLVFRNRRPSLGRGSDLTTHTLYKCPKIDADLPSEKNDTSQWSHNGSIMSLSERNNNVEMDYVQPRPGMLQVGVRASTPLFIGQRDGDAVEGTAYLFDPTCGPVGYEVKGQYLSGGKTLILSGKSPRLNRYCQEIRLTAEALRFERLN
jgi:hypothetical protein